MAWLDLLLLLPTVAHLLQDAKGKVRHWLSATIAVATSFLISLPIAFWTEHKWYVVVLTALAIHLSIFDPLYNWQHGHSIVYHGTYGNKKKAITDRLWSLIPLPLIELAIRLFILIAAIGLYYDLFRYDTY